jgi:hypothetical protein
MHNRSDACQNTEQLHSKDTKRGSEMSIPVLLAVAATAALAPPPAARGELVRDEFPPRFLFGTGTSAYQVLRVALVRRL